MKNYIKSIYTYLLLAVIIGLFVTSCSDNTTDPVAVDESMELVKYLEGTDGGYINLTGWSMMTVAEVKTAVTADPASIYLIDIRSEADFALGHISGAVNVAVKDLLTHYQTNNLSAKPKVAVICYSGQTAGYATSLLRIYGLTNVFSMKFGMSAWHKDFDKWTPKVSNEMQSTWDNVNVDKPAATGTLPKLNTGKTTGKDILESRINTLLAEGFSTASIAASALKADMSKYFIGAYWSNADYNKGHVTGAYNYVPKSDFKLSTFIKTLPTDKPIAMYCYTGHTCAFAMAYLRVLGYDAKSILYGASGLNVDFLKTNSMSTWKDTDCMNYEYIK